MTDPKPPTMKKHVTAKLKALALKGGLALLPGEGTLTLATRKIAGGREQVISYIRMAAVDGDPHAAAFIHVWDDLKTWEQKLATLDDVCAASGVAPVKLVKAVVGTAYETGVDVANMVAAHAHPDIVEKSVEMAKKDDGIEDRKMLLQHHGFLPVNKGTSINIGVSASASAQAAAAASGSGSVPSFLDDVESVLEAKDLVQKQLIAAQSPDPTVADLFATPAKAPVLVDAELV